MNTSDFIVKLKETLEIEEDEITLNTELTSINGYDSMSVLSLIILIDQLFNLKVTSIEFRSLTTIQSLINIIGASKFKE